MSTKKPASQRTPGITSAIRRGQAQAAVVVALRARQRKKRTTAVAARPVRRRAPGPRRIPASTVRALGPRESTGLLIAEGDSWFDYPMHDVLSMLEDDHGYDVESVAHKGDRVEDMAYSGGQFEEFARRLEKLLRQGRVPDAILLSGGGNDIAGEEFAMLLNHAGSALPPINQDIVRGVIDVRLRDAYAFLIGGLTEIARHYLNRPIPILTHGYDYPIPDGRGFLGGMGTASRTVAAARVPAERLCGPGGECHGHARPHRRLQRHAEASQQRAAVPTRALPGPAGHIGRRSDIS